VERQDPCTGLTDHVVICNANPKVRGIVEEIHGAEPDLDVVLIVQDRALWYDHAEWHPREADAARFHVVEGCPTDGDLLRCACIADARAAIILSDPTHGNLSDARGALVAIAIEQANPQVHTVMELLLSVNKTHLAATDINEVVCLGEIAEKLVAQSTITTGSSRLFAHLLTTESDTSQIFMEPVDAERAGRTYRDLAREVIRSGEPRVLVGFILGPHEDTEEERSDPLVVLNPRPRKEPGRDTVLDEGDRLIVIAF